MKKYTLLLLPIALFAQSGDNYDIIPRTANFIVFLFVLYYFLSKPLSNLYKNRITAIAEKLQNIQSKLRESKIQKDAVFKKIDETKVSAENLILNAKKESELLNEKAKKDLEFDMLNLEKSFKDQKDYEYKKMLKGVIEQMLKEAFHKSSDSFNKQEIIDTLIRKVG